MSADWLAAIGAMLAGVAALAACFAAFAQVQHTQRSADIQSFAIRYAVYESVVTAYAAFVQSGKLPDQHFNALARAEREAQFLFSDEARKAIERLRLELIRYVTKRPADVMYPSPGDATLESCESLYRATEAELIPRLQISPTIHPVTEILDRVDELFFGPSGG